MRKLLMTCFDCTTINSFFYTWTAFYKTSHLKRHGDTIETTLTVTNVR